MTDGVFEERDIPALMAGEPDVLRRFTTHYGELLWIKLDSRFRDKSLVEDIRQETLFRVLRTLRDNPASITQPERIGFYVNSVCRNVILENFRAEGKYQAQTRESQPPDPPDPAASQEGTLISAQMRELVERVLEELPERDRLLLTEICLDERDKDEISRAHGVDRGYLRVLLFRARQRLRELIARKTQKNSAAPETLDS